MNTPILAGEPLDARGTAEQPMLGELIRAARDHLGWIIGITGAFVLVAALYALIATPIYQSDALVRVQSAAPAPVAAGPTADQTLGRSPPTDAEIALMKSRAVLAPVVAKYKLDISVAPDRVPVLGKLAASFATPGQPAGAWFGLRSYAWGGEQLSIDAIEVPPQLEDTKLSLVTLDNGQYALLSATGDLLLRGQAGTSSSANGVTVNVARLNARPGTVFTVVRSNELNAVANLASALQIAEQGKETGIVQIRLENANPELGTNIVNEVAQSAVAQNIARRQAEANAMLTFLNTELPRLRERVRTAEQALSNARRSSGSIQSTQESQIYLQSSVEYQKQIALLSIQRTQMLQRFLPNSPEIQAIDTQLAQLGAAKKGFDARFDQLPAAERDSVNLERDAKVAQDIYVALVNRTQSLSVERGGTIGNLSVVDAAWRPSIPVKPKRALIVAAALVLGLIVSALTVFMRRTVLSGVDDPRRVEQRLNLPMFGAVYFSAEQERLDHHYAPPKALGFTEKALGFNPYTLLLSFSGTPSSTTQRAPSAAAARRERDEREAGATNPRYLLAASRPYDASVEALREVRSELQFALSAMQEKVVMVTSPTPASGKSFISANLAVLLAETGLNVLLIDADLRRGRLASYFGHQQSRGLAELLSGRIGIGSAIRMTAIHGLSIISAGAHPANPSALLSGPRLGQILASCGENFDMVIVDTPPVLAVSDASIIGRVAALTLLVLRAGAHSEQDIADTLQKLERAGGHVLGGVFNAVPERRSDRDRHAYTYAYRPVHDLNDFNQDNAEDVAEETA